MTYKVTLEVVTSGSYDLPKDLAEFADSHGITYEVPDGEGDRAQVTFESEDKQALVDMIKQSYAPEKESEHHQFIDQIQGDAPHADGESYLTYGTPEPRSDMDIHKPAEGEPDTQLEQAKAQQAGQPVDRDADDHTDETK